MNMAIKPVKSPSEIETIAGLARHIWREHYAPLIGMRQVEYMLDNFQSVPAITEQLASGYDYYLLAGPVGEPVGYLSVVPRGNDLFLSKLYVRAECRGAGYGRAAVAHVIGIAREKKLSSVTLTVNKRNLNTIAAYRKFGFTVTADVVQDIGNGFVMDDHVMTLPVQPLARAGA